MVSELILLDLAGLLYDRNRTEADLKTCFEMHIISQKNANVEKEKVLKCAVFHHRKYTSIR